MKKRYQLGVIGGGFMARAILSGAISCGVLKSSEIIVSDVAKESRSLCEKLGVNVVSDNVAVASECEMLLLAVKPQSFSDLASELHGCATAPVISIMAGKRKFDVQTALNAPCVARAMPNLPCSISEGAIGLDASDFSEKDAKFVEKLFAATGKVVHVKEEQLNAVTGISGSGSAYVYLFLQALQEAGQAEGLSKEQSLALALQTVKGAVLHAEQQSEKTLRQLIDAVCSKGGTTLAALDSFAKDDFEGAIARAVHAAKLRAEELSK